MIELINHAFIFFILISKLCSFLFETLLHLAIFATMLQKLQSRMELTGSFIAIACAIHCMAIPVMVGLGSAGVVHLFDHLFIELGFLFATMTFAGWSLFVNYRKGNVDTLPISLFIIGFTLLIISIVFHFHALSAVGGIHIAVAHYFNWKQLRSN